MAQSTAMESMQVPKPTKDRLIASILGVDACISYIFKDHRDCLTCYTSSPSWELGRSTWKAYDLFPQLDPIFWKDCTDYKVRKDEDSVLCHIFTLTQAPR